MKLRFIVNPISGRRLGARIRKVLPDFIAARRLDADIRVTEHAGHAAELAQEAALGGFSRVVAIGGDGTINEIARALVHTPIQLALVPAGSGNGLARHLGIPIATQRALELASQPASSLAIDTGLANAVPFFNAMGMGLDAEITWHFNQLKRRGLSSYVQAGFSAFAQRRAEPFSVDAGGVTHRFDALLMTIANSEQYGNGARIAPGASVEDGILDLIAVERTSVAASLLLAARLFAGSFDRSRYVRRLRSAAFVIRRSQPGLMHTDGDCHEVPAEVMITARPRSLHVVVPPQAT